MFEVSDDLREKLKSHLAGILVMGVVFLAIVLILNVNPGEAKESDAKIQTYLDAKDVDLGNPVDRALFRESLDLFYPRQTSRNDSLVRAIDEERERQLVDPGYRKGRVTGLTGATMIKLMGMYFQFVAVYGVVLLILFFAAQRIAIYRFIKMKQGRESYLLETVKSLKRLNIGLSKAEFLKELSVGAVLLFKALSKGFVMVVLFSPAYVIAYSLKTTLDTSSLPFMALLGVISNGVLIHTSNRFFTFLLAESRKGYVKTAVVKGLDTSYDWDRPGGISKRSLFRLKDSFTSHVFRHVFLNARFQFVPTLKEHASFLITGLVIIEMALNIQGHLCYELLQQILFRQYDVACAIVFGIFLTVKATEMSVDIWHDRERKKYGY